MKKCDAPSCDGRHHDWEANGKRWVAPCPYAADVRCTFIRPLFPDVFKDGGGFREFCKYATGCQKSYGDMRCINWLKTCSLTGKTVTWNKMCDIKVMEVPKSEESDV